MANVKAYLVSEVNKEYGCDIVYAENAGKAKRRGMTEFDFVERRAKRAPNLDKYAPDGPTRKQLFEEQGWWYECDECYAHTTADDGGRVVAGKIFCEACEKEANPNG